MNVWKPLALFSIAGLALSLGVQVASAEGKADLCKDQPNMRAALQALYAANASLQKAEHDKGGWRAKADEHVKGAIAETERGCGFADKHDRR